MSDDVFMVEAERTAPPVHRFRSVAENRQIVDLTLEPGAIVALVARAPGLNANQAFKWRRAFERGALRQFGEDASEQLERIPASFKVIHSSKSAAESGRESRSGESRGVERPWHIPCVQTTLVSLAIQPLLTSTSY